MESTRFLVIEFLDGKKETFTFPRQSDNVTAQKIRMEDFLSGQFVILQLENEVQLFPVSAIRSMRLSGLEMFAGAPLPPAAIRGAEKL